MIDKLKKEEVMNAYEAKSRYLDVEEQSEIRRSVLNAIDATTSMIRSCGGACTDCAVMVQLLPGEEKICDALESQGVEVYRTPDISPAYKTTHHGGHGAFY